MSTTKIECPACQGSGECPSCSWVNEPSLNPFAYEHTLAEYACELCEHNPTKCRECEGTGEVEGEPELGEEGDA